MPPVWNLIDLSFNWKESNREIKNRLIPAMLAELQINSNIYNNKINKNYDSQSQRIILFGFLIFQLKKINIPGHSYWDLHIYFSAEWEALQPHTLWLRSAVFPST